MQRIKTDHAGTVQKIFLLRASSCLFVFVAVLLVVPLCAVAPLWFNPSSLCLFVPLCLRGSILLRASSCLYVFVAVLLVVPLCAVAPLWFNPSSCFFLSLRLRGRSSRCAALCLPALVAQIFLCVNLFNQRNPCSLTQGAISHLTPFLQQGRRLGLDAGIILCFIGERRNDLE